jgi:hypothetical protein
MRLSKMSRTAYSSSDAAAFFLPLLPAAFGERLRLVERLRLAGRERWRLVERRFAAGERDAAREDFFLDDDAEAAAGEAARRRGLCVRAGDARERPDMAEQMNADRAAVLLEMNTQRTNAVSDAHDALLDSCSASNF